MEDLPFVDEFTEQGIPDEQGGYVEDTPVEVEETEEQEDTSLREQTRGELQFEDEFTEEESVDAPESEEDEEELEESEEEFEDETDEEYEDAGEVPDNDVEVPVTLANGEQVYVTYGEVVSAYQDQQTIKEAADTLRAEIEAFAAEKDKVSQIAEMTAFDAQRNLDRYSDMTDAQWQALYNEDPARYAEHQEYINRETKRLNEAKTAWEEHNKSKAERAEQERNSKNEANEAAIKEYIPNLDDKLIREIFIHAMENLNVNPETFSSSVPEPDRFIGWYESLLRKRDIEGYTQKLKVKKTTTKPAKRRVGKSVNPKSKPIRNAKTYVRNGITFDSRTAELFSDLY